MRLRSKNHYTQCSAGNWKEYPLLQNTHVRRLFNGFSISVNLSPVFRRELVQCSGANWLDLWSIKIQPAVVSRSRSIRPFRICPIQGDSAPRSQHSASRRASALPAKNEMHEPVAVPLRREKSGHLIPSQNPFNLCFSKRNCPISEGQSQAIMNRRSQHSHIRAGGH